MTETNPTLLPIVQMVLQQYRLPWFGTHGVSHWARVLENGRRLAPLTGADLRVVMLFAVLHDARRTNEGVDYRHGPDGAAYLLTLRESLADLNDEQFHRLHTAIAGHTLGITEADITLQTCWDADRLDLGRVEISPDPDRLCTPAARLPEMLVWADRRARQRHIPDLVFTEWNLTSPIG